MFEIPRSLRSLGMTVFPLLVLITAAAKEEDFRSFVAPPPLLPSFFTKPSFRTERQRSEESQPLTTNH
jgi:hypothetical protein